MADKVQIRIIEKAAEMFFSYGIRSVTVDDICRQLGMSKKTFYVYFSGKDALVEQLLRYNEEQFACKLRAWIEGKSMSELLHGFVSYVRRDKHDVHKVPQLVYDLNKYYPNQAAEHDRRIVAHQQACIAEVLHRGVAEGLVREDVDVDLAALLMARTHSDGVRHLQDLEQQGVNMAHYSRQAMEVLVRGVLSPKGLAELQP